MLYTQSKTVLGLFQLILKAWHQLLLCPTGSLMRLYYSIGYVINFMAEWVGFEPTDAFTSLIFKTSTINHSDITPLYMYIITLSYSAVNTLEQIFRIELKIKLYKSLVIPFNYTCFEFSSIYLCLTLPLPKGRGFLVLWTLHIGHGLYVLHVLPKREFPCAPRYWFIPPSWN